MDGSAIGLETLLLTSQEKLDQFFIKDVSVKIAEHAPTLVSLAPANKGASFEFAIDEVELHGICALLLSAMEIARWSQQQMSHKASQAEKPGYGSGKGKSLH